MARIYVSSTFKDLKECREKIRENLRKMSHEDIAMEYYVAEDKRPIDKCQEDVASCDLYIGIFAWRYGYVPDGYHESITELEYRKAVEEGKDCLIFLLDEDASWPAKYVDKGKDAEKIAALREELSKKYLVSFFKSADELASSVDVAVHKWEIERRVEPSGTNQKTREPISIPSIQSVLRKGITTEGDFFKKEPEWVDYEQGFIVERSEVKEIIKRLDTDKVQLVLGRPASGKSAILKNVGFKLANENKNVYVIELKKHSKDEVKLFFENIPKMDDQRLIFIVDDAHLYFVDCERLIKTFKREGQGKLIIGSRENKEIEEGYPTEASEFEYLSKKAIRINAEDITEEIIQKFLEKNYHFEKYRIRNVASNFLEFNKDLWYLSWALKAYDPNTDSTEEDKIYEKIKKEIRKKNAEDVFLPLSIFYRFEIPIERKFLEKQLGIEKGIIEDLIEISEIIETEEIRKPVMLSLYHSSIADLYFETYKNYPALGEEIKEKILNGRNEEDLTYWLFYKYVITTDLINAMDTMNHLRRDQWDEKGGAKLFEELVDDEKVIQKLIGEKIEREEDIQEIGVFVQTLVQEGRREVARKLFNHININVLLSKIEDENDISKIGTFLHVIMETENREVGRRLVDRINIDLLLLKIEKEEDIQKIGMFVRDIVRTGKIKVAGQVVDRINIESLLTKIKKEEDLQKISEFVVDITEANKEAAGKTIDHINIDELLSKIEKEMEIQKIGAFVRDMARAGRKEMVGELVDRINIDALLLKVEKEMDIQKIGAFVRNILWSERKEIVRQIVNQLNPEIREKLYQTAWWTTIKAGINQKNGNYSVQR